MIFWELKKMWKTGSLVVLASLFALLCVSMAILAPENHSKSVGENEAEFVEAVRELKFYARDYANDDFPEELRHIANDKIDHLQTEAYEDVEFWRTFDYRIDHPVVSLTLLAMMGLTLSNIYASERTSGVEPVLLSTKKKHRVLYTKLALGVVLPLVLYFTYIAIAYLITAMQYGFPVNGDLQAIRIVKVPLLLKTAYSIQTYIDLKIVIMAMLMASLGVTAVLISFCSKTSIQSISAYMAIIFLGKALLLVKWLPQTIMQLLARINYVDLLMGFDQFALMYSGNLKLISFDIDAFNACILVLCGLFVGKIILSAVMIHKKM